MKFKMPKFPRISKLPHLPRLNIEPVKKAMAFFNKHKIPTAGLVFVIAFITVALWYRGYLLSKMKTAPDNAASEGFYSAKFDSPFPSIASPTPSDTPDTNSVLGTSTKNSTYYNNAPLTLPTPFPTFAPLPTIAPLPTFVPIPATNTSPSNNSGNPNCKTASGTPNSWYSDVYPNPSASSTSNGSITLYVYIRDCNQNTAPVSDTLSISLSSGDSNTQINGNALPYSVTTQNGIASFTVTSQVSGTVMLVVQDTTSSFTVTNIYNQNPSITFTNTGSGSSTGNSNCTTGSGTPNFWYSEVSPTSPISANTGFTVTLTVNIKDCGKNNVSSDNLTFSQTSNDSSLTVNGSSAPVSIQAQNGVATFTVSSTNAGTDTFTIRDTTSNFTVTDANNHSPSIVFSGSSSTPTPSPSATPTPSPAGSPTPTPSPSGTPTPTPSPSATPTPT